MYVKKIMKKSFLSVKMMLIMAITLILVIGLIATLQIFFPFLTGLSCIQRQRNNIDRITEAINEVLLTGNKQIVRFKVEDCAKCIWYNCTDECENDQNDYRKIEVQYIGANETVPTPIVWNNIDTQAGCPGEILKGPKVCEIEITTNSVDVKC